jgi:hypothetical protein
MNCLLYGVHPASTVVIDLRTHCPALSYCVSKYFVKFVGLLEWRTWAKIFIIIIIIYIWRRDIYIFMYLERQGLSSLL